LNSSTDISATSHDLEGPELVHHALSTYADVDFGAFELLSISHHVPSEPSAGSIECGHDFRRQ
jgi:hypothetical protein